MRRALFGKSQETVVRSPAHASAGEALLFDLRDHSASPDLNLAERRIGIWALAPWLLLAGHLAVGLSLLAGSSSGKGLGTIISASFPLLISIGLDCAAG